MMQLSQHFSLEEMIASQDAARNGIDNDPGPATIERLKRTALGMEQVRMRLGAPIIVTSGYRCLALNRLLRSKDDSAHITGEAVDFICPGFGPPSTVVGVLKDAGIPFDQLIDEFGRWTHISFAPSLRGQVLKIDTRGTRPWM